MDVYLTEITGVGGIIGCRVPLPVHCSLLLSMDRKIYELSGGGGAAGGLRGSSMEYSSAFSSQ